MDGSPRYSLTQKLHEGQHSIIFRGVSESDHTPVVLKITKGEFPSPRALAQLRREYATLRGLDLPGVIRVYGLESHGNSLALVMEDAGGVALSEVIRGQPLELRRALRLGLSIARTLGRLHQRAIVHKDIKPHNILVDLERDEITLIDFGIATDLAQETPRASAPEGIEGTLFYMSPEQSGRMNRAVDQRTDLYSLGVTLYEMVTGTLPFTANDAIELVHSHIARTPAPPRTRAAGVPQVVSDIIMKLLRKGPEDRYQHALGLAADLALCLERLDERGEIAPFEIGQRDVADTLRIPQRLYGRDADVRALAAAFDRAYQGLPELVLVAGGAGIGKSMLVHEVHKSIARAGGRFIAGKFDLLQRNIPFSALTRAFEELVRQLLAESSAVVGEWRAKLQSALGANGQLMVDLIPELERIIDRQAPLPALRPTESQNRFRLVFQGFIRAFCVSGAPLVIFLDDLQWADAATLSLLHLLLTDPEGGHLLIVGAYRDNEVDASHPLQGMLSSLRQEQVAITEVGLGPLDRASVRALLADTLRRGDGDDEALDGLTKLVYEKTQGNPFFLTQFLLTLHQQGLLHLDPEAGRWSWDTAAIAAAPITDNVVELMAAKLRRLGPETRHALAFAACLDHHFDLVTLARICGEPVAAIVARLAPAIQAGLVVPLDTDYRLVSAGDGELAHELLEAPDLSITCRFLHDRVHQAALGLIDEDERQELHLRIGRRLRSERPGELRGDALFEVVRHFNLALPKLVDADERRDIAALDLVAGRSAKKATAYTTGARLLTAGVALLGERGWDDDFELAYALRRELSECEFLAGRAVEAEALFEELLGRAATIDAKAELYSLKMLLLTAQGRGPEGVAAGRAALALFDESLPETPAELGMTFGDLLGQIAVAQGDRTPESLIDAPELKDPRHLTVLRLLKDVFMPAFLVDPILGSIVVLKQVLLSLRHGHSDLSAFGYASYGYALAGPLGRPADARRFGQLALDLLERNPSPEIACRVYFGAGFYFSQTQPLRESQAHFTRSKQVGLEYGDFIYATQSAVFYTLTSLRLGDELAAVRLQITQVQALLQRTHEAMSGAQIVMLQQVVDALEHGTWWGEAIGVASPGEAAWLANIDAFGLTVVRCLHHICKLQVLVLFEEHAKARAEIEQLAPLIFHASGGPYVPDFPFYAALALAAAHDEADEGERPAIMTALLAHREATAGWAGYCPENEQHRLHIIDAEIARLRGDDLAAMNEYDRAIEWARRNSFFHHEAIANELCARFHLRRGRTQVARVYLAQARFGYERWGALAKVRQLDLKHPYLLSRAEIAGSAPGATRTLITSSSSLSAQELDLGSVIKASQALTAEITLQPLLEKIIQIMVENAGARRGVLLLDQEGELFVVAESSVDTGPYTFAEPQPLKESELVPSSVIHYVTNTTESVILDDAAARGAFTGDPYVRQRATRSILCTPLIHQAVLVGILYLEHDLTPGVFPATRLNPLKILASQAAISIENANLYANMERLVRKRTEELRRANQSLVASNAELDAFARTVAHDLKNPLGAVAGYSEYLLENIDALEISEANRVIEQIRRASETATSIVDELLLLAGVRKQQVQVTGLDMGAVIRQVEQRMSYMLREYQGELIVPDTWPAALGYAPWIEEAWTNYISNGLKYGGSPPRLVLGATPLPDGMVRFWVRDNGRGISDEAQAALFAEFTRLDEVRAEGHGLGLSIVRRIIERLGGQVGVESHVGEGSCFYFALPAAPTAKA